MGHPKAGGRVKGTPNIKTKAFLDEVREICETKGIQRPIEALLELTAHDDVEIRLAALKAVCPYLYVTRKSDDGRDILLVNSNQNQIAVTNEQLDQLMLRARSDTNA